MRPQPLYYVSHSPPVANERRHLHLHLHLHLHARLTTHSNSLILLAPQLRRQYYFGKKVVGADKVRGCYRTIFRSGRPVRRLSVLFAVCLSYTRRVLPF